MGIEKAVPVVNGLAAGASSLAQRRAALEALRTKILAIPPPTSRTNPAIPQSIAPRMRLYYPPDVNVKKLADQDPELAQLDLKDLAFEERAAREAGWRKRDKLVRVSVTEFRKHPKKEGQEIAGGKKKKRR